MKGEEGKILNNEGKANNKLDGDDNHSDEIEGLSNDESVQNEDKYIDEPGTKKPLYSQKETIKQKIEYKNPYSSMLINSKNLIFRGAPGTGKTYLAKEIATDIISNGKSTDYDDLTEEQKKQMEFVQFHPSYDYSDFVEGLRPVIKEDGAMGFMLKNGIFKEFVESVENSKKIINKFLLNIDKKTPFRTVKNREFYIKSNDLKKIELYVPSLKEQNIKLKIDDLIKMLEANRNFDRVDDLTIFFERSNDSQKDTYLFSIYNAIKEIINEQSKKPYIFIIDEINRGEISKIFGELFFAIDPGYRGKKGEISTQYANLHDNPNEKFYIPENVYIIGTMNDIDRSVDSFDFAMRRRFRFVEITAEQSMEMLKKNMEGDKLKEAISRMTDLNKVIEEVDGLNKNYQIGASYFLKLNELSFDELWRNYLEPLLHDYIQGLNDEEEIMNKFKDAYR